MSITVRKEMPVPFWVIVALAVVLPLPLGSVYQWSWGVMACVVGIALAFWSIRVMTGRQEATIGLYSIWPLASLYGIVVSWVLLQTQSFTPLPWHHPLWLTTAETLGGGTFGAISLNPFDTLSCLIRLLAYGGIFWVTVQYCRRAARAQQVLSILTYAGLAYAVCAIVAYLTGLQALGAFRQVSDDGGLTGTFVNRNCFATYAGLGLLCCTALSLVRLTQTAAPAAIGRAPMLRDVWTTLTRSGPLVFAWPVLAIAIALSHSVAGSAVVLLGLLLLSLAAASARAVDGRLALGFAALCAAAALCVYFAYGDQLRQQLAHSPIGTIAGTIDADPTLAAIRDAGVLGTGFGTFDEALRFYRTGGAQSTPMSVRNTYLENLVELGVPVALALFGVFVSFLVLCALGIRNRRRDAIYPCVGFAATIFIAAHAAIDSGVDVPAIAATYVLIIGAACAQCWSSRKPSDPW